MTNLRSVITGGPGAGKTTTLNALAEQGYICAPDSARACMNFQPTIACACAYRAGLSPCRLSLLLYVSHETHQGTRPATHSRIRFRLADAGSSKSRKDQPSRKTPPAAPRKAPRALPKLIDDYGLALKRKSTRRC